MQLPMMKMNQAKYTAGKLVALSFLIVLFGCSPKNQPVSGATTDPEPETLSSPAPVKVNTPIEEEFIYSFWDELGDHPLDKKLKACVDENAGDMGTRNCLKQSLASWNEEVAKWSDAIRNQLLRGPAADAFGQSQDQWNAYKDLEFKFIEQKYEGLSGTMYQKRIKLEKVSLVRHRGLELYAYQQALNVER